MNWDLESALDRVARPPFTGNGLSGAGTPGAPNDLRLDAGRPAEQSATGEAMPQHHHASEGDRAVGTLSFDGEPAGEDREIRGPRPRRLTFGLVALWLSVVLLATTSALFYSLTRKPIHGARVEVLYRPDSGSLSEERQLATQVALVRSRAVLEPVASGLGDVSVEELARVLEAEVLPRSNVLQLTVAHPDPVRARELLRRVASQYVAFFASGEEENDGQSRLRTLIARAIDERLAELGEPRAPAFEAPAQIEPPPTPTARRNQLFNALTLMELFELQANLHETRSEPQPPRAQLLSDVYLLHRPIRPKPLQDSSAGALVGMVIGTLMLAGIVRTRGDGGSR